MEFQTVVFYLFGAIAVAAALGVILVRNPVHAALFLVLAFFSSAAIWLLLEAEFLAIALVLVYVGAVMVLFLFVVMMLDINIDRLREGFWSNLPLGLLVAAVLVVEMVLVLTGDFFRQAPAPVPLPADASNTADIGRVLYTVYAYPFEIAAMVLLVAMVAAVSLTLRKRKDARYLDPAEQVKVKAADRLRVISMPAEKE
ncbi:MAG: NADH-quinone oxidoreductase subunit J [Tepidiphilus sp.]|jgi:NADH-quinone oxidoreductase subunit J|uniref:NADH-quinone oxidoreductase subunit J n=1 Tax=Tepidiphilus thermophilus TaxID=876478 RepID=A0A0K6IVX7_9PROT|nr:MULTISPECIES: NADH-quinone oxidoreductase subunit J [Tepidiphilus]MBP6998866.1 NADH-quinone oxidoreductase subunit J [Tepidiphilus sp.]MDK2796468.1 NADH-quinone oxidoreductase subunit [Tepidiphilus sp.]CUB07233.1 NADH dehydrogenase subunit J [Tepidiphilus thermophilus]